MFAAFHVAFVVGPDNAGSTTSNTALCNGPEIETSLAGGSPLRAPALCTAGFKRSINEKDELSAALLGWES